MNTEELFHGESKNIEYKSALPEQSEKYVKSIIAFANTQGGKLLIGVDDKTHKVVGVDAESLFQTMDRIANAISDSVIHRLFQTSVPKRWMGKRLS